MINNKKLLSIPSLPINFKNIKEIDDFIECVNEISNQNRQLITYWKQMYTIAKDKQIEIPIKIHEFMSSLDMDECQIIVIDNYILNILYKMKLKMMYDSSKE